GVAEFYQVMRWDNGCHTYGNASRAVEQQVGKTGRQYNRFFSLVIVVGSEIDCVFVDIAQQLIGDGGHFGFGVAHSGRGIIVLGAKVSMSQSWRAKQRRAVRLTT